jgi:membrane fusion protein (multidrug efflux system)
MRRMCFRVSSALATIAAGFLASACTQQVSDAAPAATLQGAAKQPAAPQYKVVPVERIGVPTVVKLPGRLAAFQEVSIFPKVNGYVKQVLVDIGSKVAEGDVLMVLEAPELEQAALQAKEKYTRAMSDYMVEREHLARLTEAAKTAGAVSPLDLSTLKAKVAADSALANAERANWEMQQTMMRYLRVTAPFSGVITERNVHPGALVSVASKDRPILELKALDHLRLQIDVPEQIAAQLRPRDAVTFSVSARPGRRISGVVSRRSNNISTQMRSERIEVDVNNRQGELSPGMYAEVMLQTQGGSTAFSVPTTAVVTSTERKYVVAVRNGVTAWVDVITGNVAKGRIEVYGALMTGERVIETATAEIREGVKVQ